MHNTIGHITECYYIHIRNGLYHLLFHRIWCEHGTKLEGNHFPYIRLSEHITELSSSNYDCNAIFRYGLFTPANYRIIQSWSFIEEWSSIGCSIFRSFYLSASLNGGVCLIIVVFEWWIVQSWSWMVVLYCFFSL